MKKKYLMGLVVIMLVLAACGGGGSGDGTSLVNADPHETDTKVNTTVPTAAKDIPDFDVGTFTYASDETAAKTLVGDAMGKLEGLLGEIFAGGGSSLLSASKTSSARAMQNESFEYYLSEAQQDIEDELKTSVTAIGYAKGTVSYDDKNITPFRLTADAKCRIAILEGYTTDDDWIIKGYIGGDAAAKNIYITDSSASGTASATVTYALSIADSSKNYVKCTITMTVSLNASKGTLGYTYKATVFNPSGSQWGTLVTGDETVSLDDILGSF
ncbi:MAG: hypothetical protein LBK62_10600 [Treponema sp.]|jgi:hypothetical protein|nr:hypothetical protein [Treponema sp.]